MAFPFFGKKKLPAPPRPPRGKQETSKTQKHIHIERGGFEAAVGHLRRLRAGVESINAAMASTQKKHSELRGDFEALRRDVLNRRGRETDELSKKVRRLGALASLKPAIEKVHELQEDIDIAHKKIIEFEKKSKLLEKKSTEIKSEANRQIAKVQKKNADELWNVRNIVGELGDAIADLRSIENKNTAKEQDEIKALGAKFGAANASISKLQDNTKDILTTFRPETMRRLKGSMESVSESFANLEKQSETNLKDLGKVTRALSSIDRRAADVEAESRETKELAERLENVSRELSAGAQETKAEIIDMKNRVNIAINTKEDSDRHYGELQARLAELESKAGALMGLRESISQINASIANIHERIKIIEKTAVKTFVIQ